MENLRIFNTEEEYQEWKDGDDYVFPNVCKVGDNVVYNNYPDPFWVEALEDISVNFYYDYPDYSYGDYSYDKINWISFDKEGVILRMGEKLYIRSTEVYLRRLYVSGKYNVGGSILSLVYGSNYLQYNTHTHSYFSNTYLFQNATSLISAKDLVLAEVLPKNSSSGNAAYTSLFSYCPLLTDAPRLPNIDNQTNQGFQYMFKGCIELTAAPTIKTINSYAGNCCNEMFSGCSNLSFIKLMNTNTFGNSSSGYYQFTNWVNGVSSTGTFITSSKRTDFTRGVSGIPEGWDLYLYDEDNDRYVVKFKVNGIPYEFYTDEPRDITWQEFVNSDKNTNGLKVASTEFNNPVKLGSDYVLLNNEKVAGQYYIIINASYTIGQPTTTTEE